MRLCPHQFDLLFSEPFVILTWLSLLGGGGSCVVGLSNTIIWCIVQDFTPQSDQQKACIKRAVSAATSPEKNSGRSDTSFFYPHLNWVCLPSLTLLPLVIRSISVVAFFFSFSPPPLPIVSLSPPGHVKFADASVLLVGGAFDLDGAIDEAGQRLCSVKVRC